MKKLVMLMAAMLMSCATGYHQRSFNGGFSEAVLTTHNQTQVIDVHFEGNGYTSAEDVRKMTYRRTKEICKGRHLTSFEVLKTIEYNGQELFDHNALTLWIVCR